MSYCYLSRCSVSAAPQQGDDELGEPLLVSQAHFPGSLPEPYDHVGV